MSYECPFAGTPKGDADCDRMVKATSLSGWKRHMTRKHGGYESDALAAIIAANPQQESPSTTQAEFHEVLPDFPERLAPEAAERELRQARTPRAEGEKKKKISTRSKELNSKVDQCIDLLAKHMMGQSKPGDPERLSELRGEIVAASFGAQFDFDDEKIVGFTGRFWLIIVIILLYLGPNLPTTTVLLQKMQEQRKAQAEKKEVVQ